MSTVRTISSTLAAAGLLAGASAVHAQASGRFIGDVSVRTGYTTNPFLRAGDGTGSAYGEIAFSPNYIITEATASTELSGNLRLTEYLDDYSTTKGYGLTARHARTFDERTDASLSINFDSSVLGEREILLGIPGEPDFPDPLDPTMPIDPDLPDVALIGVAQRQTVLGADASVTRKLSAFDSVTATGGAKRTWYQTPLANDYRGYDTSLAYRRTISDQSTIGVYLGANWTRYDSGVGDAAIYSPRVTYTRKLSSVLSLEAALGAQFIQGSGGTGNSSGFSGNVNLCRTMPRSSLCFNASREAGASGAGGIREQTAAGLSYSYRLAEYDSLRANVSYSKFGSSRIGDPGSEYLNGDVTWERRLTQRLLGGVNLAYRDVYGSSQASSPDVNVQVFVRYSLGQLR